MKAILAVLFAVLLAFVVVPASSRAPHCKNCFKVLNTDIKNAAKKSMTAVVQAGLDLTKMRDEFADQQYNLEANLKKAKAMSELIKEKIKTSVKAIATILEDATKKAKEKMAEVSAASDALGALEKNVSTEKVQDKAKKIRAEIVKGKPEKSKLQKDVLNENGVIATLDAAKILAKAKAEKTEKQIEEKKAVVRDDIARLENNMASAENQLDSEEKQELDDEKEARSKIQEAVKHNQIALSKAKQFLLSVEKGIEKFHEDIKQVPLS